MFWVKKQKKYQNRLKVETKFKHYSQKLEVGESGPTSNYLKQE